MTAGKTILVLGGGVGGVTAARLLRRRLPRMHCVVLVEREPQHVFAPSLLWLMIGERRARQIARPIAALEKYGIEVIHGDIERIEPQNRAVSVDGHTLYGDFLVVSLGAELAPEAIPGLVAAGHNLYTLAGAESIDQARQDLRSGRLAILVCGVPFKCPAAPYEAAMLLEYDLRRRDVREQVRVDLYTPEPGPMPIAGPAVSVMVRGMVEAKGIGYHPEHAVTQVDTAARRIHFAHGAAADFDFLVYVPPHRAPRAVHTSGLVGESGWVPVNRATLETKFPGVYAIGDVTGIPLAVGKPLPKAGVFAHREAEVVTHHIAAAIAGRGEPRSFDGHGECFVETGDGRAGFGRGEFFAEPAPRVRLYQPNRGWHLGKVLYEQYWLRRWF